MITSSGDNPDQGEKQAYLRNIEAKLAEKSSRLRYIKRKVKTATEAQRIQVSEQLLRAEHRADSSVKALQEQLELLETADDETWVTRRFQVEAAWDELSQAIKKVVARFP